MTNLFQHNSDFKIDTYLCFWNESFGKNDYYNKKSVNTEKLIDLYKPKKSMVLNLTEVEKEILVVLNKVLENNRLPMQGADYVKNSICAQMFCWKKCLSIVEGEYDLLIKNRFDLQFNKPIALKDVAVSKNEILCNKDNLYHKHGFSDTFFIAQQKTFFDFMSSFDMLKDYKSSQNLYAEIVLTNIHRDKNIIASNFGTTIRR